MRGDAAHSTSGEKSLAKLRLWQQDSQPSPAVRCRLRCRRCGDMIGEDHLEEQADFADHIAFAPELCGITPELCGITPELCGINSLLSLLLCLPPGCHWRAWRGGTRFRGGGPASSY